MSGCSVCTSLLLFGSYCTDVELFTNRLFNGRLDCFQLRTLVNKDAGSIPRQASSSGAGSRMGEMPGGVCLGRCLAACYNVAVGSSVPTSNMQESLLHNHC